MNRTKSILLAGAATFCLTAAQQGRAENGVAYVQKPIAAPSGSQSDQQAQAIKELTQKFEALQATMPKAPAAGKKTNAAFSAQVSKFQADLDDAKLKLDSLSSGGGAGAGGGGAGGGAAGGGSSQSTTSVPEIPNSDSNYLDDHLKWDMPIHVYQTGSSGGLDQTTAFCLPADTRVVGLSSSLTSVTSGGSSSSSSSSPASSYLPVRLDTEGALFLHANDTVRVTAHAQATGDASAGAAMCDNLGTKSTPGGVDTSKTLTINADTQFYVSQADLDHAALREGWDYGTLIVPFKFQMSDKSILTGSASLGGYVGYSIPMDLPGFRLRPIGFVGVSEISLPQSGSGSGSSSQTIAGLSYGLGVMGTIKDKFNISLVFGADHVSGNSTYQYQDKPWVSFALGYSFTK